jgi:hypothetical protein
MNDPFSLAGRVALVTGASRGLGYAMAEALAAREAKWRRRCGVPTYAECSKVTPSSRRVRSQKPGEPANNYSIITYVKLRAG